MCGLSGVAGSVWKREEDVFENLLYFMAIRGMHSTGVATVDYERRVRLAKEVGAPEYLIGTKDYNKAFSKNLKVILGHNRFATKGKVDIANAHPFAFKHVVGMHNGTVCDFAKNKLPNAHQFTTDSEAIIASIETQGIEKTVPNLDGAWALVWYDGRDDTINMIRNKDRPLYFAFSKDHQTLFWGSEVELLASAMNRNNIQRTDGEKSHLLTPDTLMSWRLPKSNAPFADPTRKTLKGWTYQPSTSTSTGRTGRFKAGKWVNFLGDDPNDPLPEEGEDMSPFGGHGPFVARTPSKTGPAATSSDVQVSGLTDTMSAAKKAVGFKNFRDSQVTPFRQPSKTAAFKSAVGTKTKGLEEIYRDDITKIWFDAATGKYTKHQWVPATRDWVMSEFSMKPDFLVVGKPPASEDEVRLYETPTIVIFKNKKERLWIRYEFDAKSYAWHRVVDNRPPLDLPFTEVDVLSTHAFRHKGKKGAKQVFYKGWNSKELDPKSFNEITATGCVGCGRTPTWKSGQFGGVVVHFIGPDEFLCEHCGDPETVKAMVSLTKSSEADRIAAAA